MSELKHTQGPWSWHGVELLSPTEFVLATSRGSHPIDANAYLIAAAPDLLKALKAMRDECMGMVPDCAEIVDAAIDKAEGRK